MNIIVEVSPPMANTTLYLYQEDVCVIIDPANPDACVQKIAQKKWKPLGVLLTHSHYDHIAGLEALLKEHPETPVYIHPLEKEALFRAELNLSSLVGAPFSLPPDTIVKPVENHKELQIPSPHSSFVFRFQCLHVPGHSAGSMVYEFATTSSEGKEITYLATGDFLFEGTIGRTDLAGGSSDQMQASLKLFKTDYEPRIGESIYIIPGHAASMVNTTTTLEKELRTNPYLYRLVM
ncbi:MAG: MBL fold metallo-hydrolase [Caldisericia bacterium]|nr:MBL fold metallo-hydrolase [Caldisericia bacterium]